MFFIIFQISGCIPSNKNEKMNFNLGNSTSKQEKQLLILYQNGLDELNLNNYNNAKIIFEKVINESNNNKEMYLKIEKEYEKIDRLDDAYYFISMAIDKKVDVDNMKILLADIESKFEVVNLNSEIKKYASFTLPDVIKMKINNAETDVKITWNSSKVDTTKPGTYTFNGYSEEYHHKVNFTLVIDKPVYKTLYGTIRGSLSSNGKRFVLVDIADDIYDGDKAKAEFDKVEAYSLEEDGSKKYYFNYFVVDNNHENTKYELTDNTVMRIAYVRSCINTPNYKIDNSFKEEILSKPAVFLETYDFYFLPIKDIDKYINLFGEIKVEDNRVIEINQIPDVYRDIE